MKRNNSQILYQQKKGTGIKVMLVHLYRELGKNDKD